MHATPEGQARPISTGETVAFVLTTSLLAVAALIASTLGRFLSFGGPESTLSAGAFDTAMGFAVYGPFLIAVVAFLIGLFRLVNRRRAWLFPLIGIGLIIVEFYTCAGAIGS
jgi:hypothetical protein